MPVSDQGHRHDRGRGNIPALVEFIHGRAINWRRVWLIVLIMSIVIIVGGCTMYSYLQTQKPWLFAWQGYYDTEGFHEGR